MDYTVFFTRDALADLEGIIDHIAADNPARAFGFVDEIRLKIINTLSIAPHGGRKYSETVRVLALGSYVALYETDEATKRVFILNVVHGRRNWNRPDLHRD
jgi:toxin ParE1/3/4